MYPDTDCEDTYGPYKINIGNICQISDIESEEEEWKELSPNMKVKEVIVLDRTQVPVRNKEEGVKPPKERIRRQSGRRKSISSDRNGSDKHIGKIR